MDEQVARRDRELADLLDQFVTVRVIQANGLDLSLIQYDFDLTWAVVFLHADRTIYGRYGSRDARDGSALLTIPGLRKTMQAVLDLHREYPSNKKLFVGKTPAKPAYATPEMFPSLKPRFQASLDPSAVRKSCIHCHMIHDAQRRPLRDAKKPLPDELLWAYPLPSAVGLELDPKERAKIVAVSPKSPAAKAGIVANDELQQLHGQPVTSLADVQWILNTARDGETLTAKVKRGDKELNVNLSLPERWRRQGDFSWRTSTWDLRRMALGGLVLEDMPDKERAWHDLALNAMALQIRHVGQYGEHAVGKNAGFQKGDVIVEFAGLSARQRECDVIAHVLQNTLA